LAAITLATVVAIAALAGPAEARSGGVVSFERPTAERPALVERYWTPRRIAAARPLAATVESRGGMRIEPQGPRRNHPIPFTSGPVVDPLLSGASVHGKLLVRIKRIDFECSATSVSSLNRSVLMTAAHCVYRRGRGFARKLAFLPAYGNHLRPLGTWIYDAVYIPREWFAREAADFDFAAVVAGPREGRLLNDAVGAVPLAANYPREQQTYSAVGYPANFADAQQMWRCDSPYGGDDPKPGGPGAPAIAIGCDMGVGASGGGWILSGGAIGSVSAFGYDQHPNVLYGPYFGQRALELFGKAEQATPGAGAIERRFAACVAESRGCSHRFVAGDLPVLRFEDRREARTAYRACVDGPGAGPVCADARTGRRGRSDYLTYQSATVGRHVATWSVDGVEVERWAFRIFPENA
jgi:hypothetical protein